MAARKISSKKTKRPLSRSRVLKQAVRLADKNGIEALSMRRLAESLHVEAMSLYNHVGNKDDVIDGMVNLVIDKFDGPDSAQQWKKALRHSAMQTHDVLLKHPWAAQQMISRVIVSDGMLRYSDASLGCFVDAGFSYAMADHAWNALHNHIYGFTLSELNAPIETSDYAHAAEEYLPYVPEDKYPHVNAMMKCIMAGEHSGINNFEFGLDLILDGLEEILHSEKVS